VASNLLAAIFDYGGVMAKSPIGRVHMLARELNTDPELVISLLLGESSDYLNPWFEAECGRQPLDQVFEEKMQKICDPFGITFRLDIFLPWVTEAINYADEEMSETVRWLKSKDIPVALLTNSVPEFRSVIEKTIPIHDLFNVIVDSSEVGYRKPDRKIYEITAGRLGVQESACLMVDDLEHNVFGARQTGMTAIHFKDSFKVKKKIFDLFNSN
tara:strand:+ start:2089 stop:2730 length:642 start_codon:yes stop_codon:yes gene_type:complete